MRKVIFCQNGYVLGLKKRSICEKMEQIVKSQVFQCGLLTDDKYFVRVLVEMLV